MRLFIALTLPPAAIAAISRHLQPYKQVSGPIKWAKPEHIHLTLKFLGDTSAEKEGALKTALATPAYGVAPFNLTIAGFGVFGRARGIAIFWAGVAPCAPLLQLQRQIEERTSQLGFAREERPHQPHITVGRNQVRHDFKPLLRLVADQGSEVIAAVAIDRFALYSSVLRPAGPQHTKLMEFACA